MELRTAHQLELLLAEATGFDERNVQVVRVGAAGDFRADFVGAASAVSASRAKQDVEVACRMLRRKYLLKDR